MRNSSTKKRIVIAVCLSLVGVLGVAGTVGYLAFLRGPANSPAEACADGRTPGTGPVVVTAGASITQGALGADWVDALRGRAEYQGYEFVNAGVNGNTSADLLARVDTDILACHPTAVTLLIGTNDVRNDVPVDQYRNTLGSIVDRIKSGTSARIALMSLPPLGEDLGTGINHKLRGYNAAIKETADRARVSYLPVHEQMTDFLHRQGGGRKPYDFGFALAYGAATKHYLLGHSWDDVARARELELFVDHIHLSDRGGAIVGGLTAAWLSTMDPPR